MKDQFYAHSKNYAVKLLPLQWNVCENVLLSQSMYPIQQLQDVYIRMGTTISNDKNEGHQIFLIKI